MRVVNRFLREAVNALFLEVLKARLDGLELHFLGVGAPTHDRGLGTKWSLTSFPTQDVLCFYDFMISDSYRTLFVNCSQRRFLEWKL